MPIDFAAFLTVFFIALFITLGHTWSLRVLPLRGLIEVHLAGKTYCHPPFLYYNFAIN